MRPLKLTMTAFGPYRDRETVDFRQLEHHRLFVISGNTGAGKTSIFDAVCFALYGTASGEDRYDARMLRSHFADEDTHTSVELEFAVGQRTYRVFRQLGHRKGGNKTETGARTELYETTGGTEVPCTDRFTVSDVNRKLEDILGLTKDQFGQIVMLPQGEFRKLLTSETENKEEILRRIFRTTLYRKLEDRLQQQSRELKETLKGAQTEQDIYVKQVAAALPEREDSALFRTLAQEYRSAPQVADGLAQEAVHYRREAEDAALRKAEADRRQESKEAELRAALALNERFRELEAKRAQRESLRQRQDGIAAQERRLALAVRAAQLAPYEEQRLRAAADAERRRQAYEAKLRELEAARAEAEQAAAQRQAEAAREDERRDALRELQRLGELAPAVQALDERQRETQRLAAEERALAEAAREAEAQLEALRRAKQTGAERLRALEQEAAALPERQEALRRMREQAKLLKAMLEDERRLQEYAGLEARWERELQTLRAEYERLETIWIEGQASLLAAHLHDGRPCPVCGSEQHPAKAVPSAELPSRELLQQRKEELLHVEREFVTTRSQLAATRSGLDERRAGLAEYGPVPNDLQARYDELVREGSLLKQEVERLERSSAQLPGLKREEQERDEQLERIAREKEQAAARHRDVLVQLSAKQALLEQELERIPAELRSPDRLAERMNRLQSHSERLERAWKAAQERLQAAETRLAAEQAHAGQLARQREEAEALKLQAEERFALELGQAGFADAADYARAKLSAEQREALQAELDAFRTAWAALERHIAELERELAGQTPADAAGLSEELAAVKRECELAAAAHQQSLRLAQEAERLGRLLTAAHERARELEAELARLLDVYQIMKGDNPLKMSFERYILIEFLEQILHAANVRLRALSGGQFVLQRSDRLEKHNRQSGLGLDVYDAYTGQTRDVKTLSGGEKFNASLCLALGMTDVIQSHQGGVSIEMMFIDEGFGSLDEDALGKAIETLVDLQRSGRMIGVISHVQELKAAFPAVLEVRKTKEGYSRTAISVK